MPVYPPPFANAPTITGRAAVLEQMTTLLGKVKSLAHPLRNVWQDEGGVVIFSTDERTRGPLWLAS